MKIFQTLGQSRCVMNYNCFEISSIPIGFCFVLHTLIVYSFMHAVSLHVMSDNTEEPMSRSPAPAKIYNYNGKTYSKSWYNKLRRRDRLANAEQVRAQTEAVRYVLFFVLIMRYLCAT